MAEGAAVRAVLLTGRHRDGAGARLVAGVAARLWDGVGELSTVACCSARQVTAEAGAAVARGVDLVVVLGGDGSAHVAVQACAGTPTALAVVPAGTGNDLARALGMPADPLAAARAVAAAARRPRRMDLGRTADGRWFATVLCAGFDSAVNERTNRMRWPAGRRRYDLAILAELAAFRPAGLLVEAGDRRYEGEATLVAVGNTAYYGGGIPICPDADASDGAFEVTVVGACKRTDLLRILPRLRTGRHVDHPVVTTMRADHVALSGTGGWIAYCDGERQSALPVSVHCEPGALRVVKPVSGMPSG